MSDCKVVDYSWEIANIKDVLCQVIAGNQDCGSMLNQLRKSKPGIDWGSQVPLNPFNVDDNTWVTKRYCGESMKKKYDSMEAGYRVSREDILRLSDSPWMDWSNEDYIRNVRRIINYYEDSL